MAALGVASFGHLNGVHMQNLDSWDAWGAAIEAGRLPLARAYEPTVDERLIRELVLQLKLGRITPAYFAGKYQVDILARFAEAFASLQRDGYLAALGSDTVALTRDGLLRVDVLLPRFFLPGHTGIRYT